MNGAEILVGVLRAHGVEHVSVLCGNGLDPFLQACMDQGVRLIDTRNEQAAAYIADTWGAMTGRLGVVAVSSGPGHTNALTGLANAWWDGRPLLLISGCSEGSTRGLGHFQELDQIGMTAPVCKYTRLIERPDQLAQEAQKAIAIALQGRPGAVHLTVTADVMGGTTPAGCDETPAPRQALPSATPDVEKLRDAAGALDNAERPVIVAGSGCFYAGSGAELESFTAATDIPVFSMMWDRCCIDSHLRQYVGPTTPECNGAFPLVAEADVILTLGARVDHRLGYGRPPVCSPDAEIVRVDVDASESPSIIADPKSFLQGLARELPAPRKHTVWLERLSVARTEFVAKWDDRLPQLDTPVPAMCVVRAIKPFLDRDITFLLDGGNIGRWAHMILWDRHPSFWQTCGASGVVGWGIPGAVGAKLARPDHPLLLLSGDGSAGFTLGDIETALRHKTPFVAVVASDCAWGIVAEGFEEGQRCGSALGEIRFDKVAEALGARGVYIEHGSQIAPAIEEGLALDTVTFIHVPIQLGGIAYWDSRLS